MLSVIEQVEKEYNIKIIFASVVGSRAFGKANPDSDWDLRAVYVQNPIDMIRINPPSDNITLGKSYVTATGAMVDFVGWNLNRTVNLMSKSNGTLLEMLLSPLVVFTIDDQIASLLRNVAKDHYDRSILYNMMARSADKDIGRARRCKRVPDEKAIANAFRGLLVAQRIRSCSEKDWFDNLLFSIPELLKVCGYRDLDKLYLKFDELRKSEEGITPEVSAALVADLELIKKDMIDYGNTWNNCKGYCSETKKEDQDEWLRRIRVSENKLYHYYDHAK